MNKTVIEVQVRAVLPTSGGCAVFIGNNDKVFIIYVDQTVGSAITMFMRQITKERPLTHDLMGHLMTALGAKVDRVIINDLKNATYYARVIIRVENELQQKKIIELDGRPSELDRIRRGSESEAQVSHHRVIAVDCKFLRIYCDRYSEGRSGRRPIEGELQGDHLHLLLARTTGP